MIHPGAAGRPRHSAIIVCWSLGLVARSWCGWRTGRRSAAPPNPSKSMGGPIRPRRRALRTANRSAGRPLAALLLCATAAFARFCLISLPLLAFLTFQTGQQAGPYGLFVAALGTFALTGFLGASRSSR